jgi:hypothetical protein
MFVDVALGKYTIKSVSRKPVVEEDKEVILCKWIH